MANQIAGDDVFGELLEQGASQQAKKPVQAKMPTKMPALPKMPVIAKKPTASLPKRDLSGLDWLEKMAPRGATGQKVNDNQKDQELKEKQQVERLKAMDQKRSAQMYEEIQRELSMIRRKKAMEPTKNITGATGYDPEQHQNPESFWDKMKKKKEAMKKKLPWTSKQGMGTGEITRGVSG